jgi:hypothetical protein
VYLWKKNYLFDETLSNFDSKKPFTQKKKIEQFLKKTNVQPKDNIKKCKYINGAYNKKLWEVIKWGQTNNLCL